VKLEDGLGELGWVARRSPFIYATTWPLDEVDIVQADGSELRLLVKQLDGVQLIKPPFVCNPAREIAAYGLLADTGLDTARCYASGRWWLALERVEAAPLWQHADVASWAATARWAARLHARFYGRRFVAQHLLVHNESFYNGWFDRARAIVGEELEALRRATDTATARLVALPPTLIHGELYPSNVLVGGDRVTVVDWETAASGPGVIDLAALVTGAEGDAQLAMAAAFGGVEPSDLAAARLVLALQWLGWAKDWHPPREHRRDWLAEAHAAAKLLA
jgi:hypothetical protein